MFTRDWTTCSNLLAIASIVNIIQGDVYDHLLSLRICTFMFHKMSSKMEEANGQGQELELAIILH